MGSEILLFNKARSGLEVMACGAGQVSLVAQVSPSKAINEDCAAAFGLSDEQCVMAIADGVGGAPRGDDASRMAIEALAECLQDAQPGEALRPRILDAFELAHQRITALGIGAATTFTVVEVSGKEIRTFHTGDSGCLVTGQRGKLKLRTTFHSPVGYAEEAGLLNEQEAITHPQRHIVSNLIGAEGMSIDIGSPLTLGELDTVVLASDGLFDNARTEEISELIRSGPLEQASARLREFLEQRMQQPQRDQPSKPDDLSFILYRPRRTRRAASAAGDS